MAADGPPFLCFGVRCTNHGAPHVATAADHPRATRRPSSFRARPYPRRSRPTLSLSCRVSILFFFLALEPSRAAPVAGAPTNSGRRPPIPRTQGLLVFPCTYSKLSRAQPRVSPTGIDPAPAGHHWSTSKLYPRRRFVVSGELLLDSLHGEHLLPSLARFPSSPGLLPLPARPSACRRRSSSRRPVVAPLRPCHCR